MSKLKTYKFSDLYKMSSGISSKPEQAGHGSQFVSFKTVFKNYFLPDVLTEFMDISEKEKEIYSIKKGDILLTRTSEVLDELGMSCVAIKDYPESSFSGFLKRLKPIQDNVTYDKFMAFYLRSDLFRKTMTNNSIMTLRASLNEQIFSYLELILPDFNEQKKAGDFLYSINRKIEINNRINSELEAMAKTLYDYWFVQFDFPDANGKPYKTSGGKMVWNKELKREIPVDWLVKYIPDFLNILTGKKDANFATENGEFPFFTCASKIYSCDEFAFEGKSILIAGNGDFNVKCYDGKFNAYQRTYVLIPNEEKYYSLIFMRVCDELEKLKKSSRGSIIKFITIGDIQNIGLVIPKNGNDTLFEKLNTLTKLISENIKENQELSSLRDWLLPMLMNGQVSVGAVEKEYKIEEEVLGRVAKPKIIYFNAQEAKIRRKMLATYIVNQSLEDLSFGKTKFEKLLHLIEYHILKHDYQQKYTVQAAGPYDGGFTKVFWNEVVKSKWFDFKEYGNLKRIVASDNHSKSLKDYGYLSEIEKTKINDFISLFKKGNYEIPEIVSTLYAVWNNRILKNEMINDSLLKKDFLEWDSQKIRYQDRLDGALDWMRNHQIIPDGCGKLIERSKRR